MTAQNHNQLSCAKVSKNWIAGIDFLRAFMSVCVVAWHMVLFGTSSIWDKEHYSTHFFTISDLINFHVLVLAVPTFILVSCYLRAIKNSELQDLQKQMSKLVLLAVFWTAVSGFWANGARGLLTFVPRSPWEFLVLVLS